MLYHNQAISDFEIMLISAKKRKPYIVKKFHIFQNSNYCSTSSQLPNSLVYKFKCFFTVTIES